MSNNSNNNSKKQKKQQSDDEVVIKKKVKVGERKPPKQKTQFQKLLKENGILSATPITAYSTFTKKKWEELKSQSSDPKNPGTTFTEHSKLLASIWKSMTEDDKAPYYYESNMKEKERLYHLANMKAKHYGKDQVDTHDEETREDAHEEQEAEQEQPAQEEEEKQEQPEDESPVKLSKPKHQGSVQKSSKNLKLQHSPYNAVNFARQSLGGKKN